MSSFVFYKIPFEGKIEAVYQLIQNRDWNVSVKTPENGVIYMKVPEDAEDEVLFNQDLVFDENTQSKFGTFKSITETEFEDAQNIDISNNTSKIKDEVKIEKNKINSDVEISQKENNIPDSNIKKFNSIEENKKENQQKKNLNKMNITDCFSSQGINFNEVGKNISKNYKDPYDYFFSQNYLITFFIIAIICLIIFRF